jgi:hypothetical protein
MTLSIMRKRATERGERFNAARRTATFRAATPATGLDAEPSCNRKSLR